MTSNKSGSVVTPVRAQHHPSREEDGAAREQKLIQKVREVRTTHESVMVAEVLKALEVTKDDVVVDATAGLGGHSEALLNAGAVKVVSLDADPNAVEAARARLASFGKKSEVIEANFRDVEVVLGNLGVAHIDKALFDLGWNMTQLTSGRGFSFLSDDPLNMSYGTQPASGFDAKHMVNVWAEKILADIFYGYGEERYSRRIAKAIVEARAESPITTSKQLADIISASVPAAYRRGRIHPATKSFQALRIAVNDELGSIEKGLAGLWGVLKKGGRIAVITFHSTEDRVVKKRFAELVKKGEGVLLTKKPVAASAEESRQNPSARSAKVRSIEKI